MKRRVAGAGVLLLLLLLLLLLQSLMALAGEFKVYHPNGTTATGGVTPVYFLGDPAMYYVRMDVGNPPQLQTMVLDTGIDVTFLVERNTCPSSLPEEPGLTCYDTSVSETFRTSSAHGNLPREYCRISADYFQFESLNGTATDFIFCLGTYEPSAYADWHWDGVIGMNYLSTGDEFEPVTQLWPQQWADVYSLDFNGDRGDSWLYLGGSDSIEGLVWSETTVTRKPRNVEFTLFQSGMCGEQLKHESTNILLSAVATDTPCLALPDDLYHQLMAWIDADCEEDDEETPGSFHCTFPPGTEDAMASLPSYRFRLAQDGEELFVPLEVLASQETSLKDHSVRVSLCVENMKEVYNSNTYVVMGTRVLEALYMVVDMRIRRVAFRQKEVRTVPERCPARPQCAGQQTYDGTWNVCVDPPCSDYFFQYVDDETKTCRVSKVAYLVVALVIGVMCVLEVLVGEAYIRVARAAAADAHSA